MKKWVVYISGESDNGGYEAERHASNRSIAEQRSYVTAAKAVFVNTDHGEKMQLTNTRREASQLYFYPVWHSTQERGWRDKGGIILIS